jgi:hypothetical protein
MGEIDKYIILIENKKEGYHSEELGVDRKILLEWMFFTTASRPALGPTQPPIHWIPEALSLGVKRPGREVNHSPPSSAEVKE